jgi:hypothetical protein
MAQLREKKERLQYLEVRNIELSELLNEHAQAKKIKYHR